MAIARVNCFIHAPIQKVFELMTDHEHYDRLDCVDLSNLLKEGNLNRNGMGAIRELKVASVRFIELISAFQAPSRFEYKVQQCYLCIGNNGKEIRFPLIHQRGQITLEEHNGGTIVYWLSQFSVALPFGEVIAKLMRPFVERNFGKILQDCKVVLS